MRKSILFLAAVAMMFVFASCGGNSPKDAAESYAEMVKAQDYEGIADMMAFPDDMSKEDKDAAKALFVSLAKEKMSKEIETREGIDKYEIGEEKISEDGKTAEVSITFYFKDGSKEEDSVDLELVDDEWKLPYMK